MTSSSLCPSPICSRVCVCARRGRVVVCVRVCAGERFQCSREAWVDVCLLCLFHAFKLTGSKEHFNDTLMLLQSISHCLIKTETWVSFKGHVALHVVCTYYSHVCNLWKWYVKSLWSNYIKYNRNSSASNPSSFIICSPSCWWKVGWSFSVHKIFRGLHTKTVWQLSPERLKQLWTCFKMKKNKRKKACVDKSKGLEAQKS